MNSESTPCTCRTGAEHLRAPDEASLRHVLVLVLAINILLFAGGFSVGAWIRSSGLQADALDSFGDASVYALSLFVVGRSLRWRAGAAMFKGIIQAAFGVVVLVEAVRRWLGDMTPSAPIMTVAAGIALAANFSCFLLLLRYRERDINLRSAWLCSRNDLINNVGVIVAAGLVMWTDSGVPDAVVGLFIATLFLRTSFDVLQGAWRLLRTPVDPLSGACVHKDSLS